VFSPCTARRSHVQQILDEKVRVGILDDGGEGEEVTPRQSVRRPQTQQELWRLFSGKGKSKQEKERRVSNVAKEGTT